MKKFIGILLIVVVLAFTGCAQTPVVGGAGAAGASQIQLPHTPKEKATMMMAIYDAQDKDYRTMAAQPNLTADQKAFMQKKKAIMIKVYPLIKAYEQSAVTPSGSGPSSVAEQEIIVLLNQLTTLIK